MDKDLNEVNISDLLPKPAVESFKTFETSAPEFLKEAAMSDEEDSEKKIKRHWAKLVSGLTDFVLAEQLTELELRGMGKPVAENYSAYFHETLEDIRKDREKAEARLNKLIPRHSQMDSCEFFDRVEEQCQKEAEARERAMAEYPFAGVEKLELKDVARKGLKKEAVQDPNLEHITRRLTSPTPVIEQPASDVCTKCGSPTGSKPFMAADKTYCEKCHDAGFDIPEANPASTSPGSGIPALPQMAEAPQAGVVVPPAPEGMLKEAAAKWQGGQELIAKRDGSYACVAYVDEIDKIYIIKVQGTMSPSYYTYEEAHELFNATKEEDSKWAKSHGL